jgi:hypothetical protein
MSPKSEIIDAEMAKRKVVLPRRFICRIDFV